MSASAALSRPRILATTGSGALAMNAGVAELAPHGLRLPSRPRPGPWPAGRSAATSIAPAGPARPWLPAHRAATRWRRSPSPARPAGQRPDQRLVGGQAGRVQPAEPGRDPLRRPQALVGAEPADLGDHLLQRRDLGLGGRRRAQRRVGGRPRPRSTSDSPPVSAVHSSSVTNGTTGCSSRSSSSSTWPSTRRVASAARAARRRAAAWPARRTSRRPRPRRSGRARRSLGELEGLEVRVDLGDHVLQPGQDPPVGRRTARRAAAAAPSTVAPFISANRVAFHSLLQKLRRALAPTPRRPARRRRGWRRGPG